MGRPGNEATSIPHLVVTLQPTSTHSHTHTHTQPHTHTHSDDIVALVLTKPDAISEWRELLGPTNSNRAREEAPESLRARYGHDQTKNALHGSDSYLSAEREIKFMFPECECGVVLTMVDVIAWA